MGSGFTTGLKNFGMGVLGAVPNVINGALGGMAMGPEGALVGGLSGLVGGVAQGISNLTTHSENPAGPQSVHEAASSILTSGMDAARTALSGSGLLADGGAAAKSTLTNFFKGVASGQSLKGAAQSAGLHSHFTAAAQGARSALITKANNFTSVNPSTAIALGNPLSRTILGRTGKGSVLREQINDSMNRSAAALGIRALQGGLNITGALGGGHPAAKMGAVPSGTAPTGAIPSPGGGPGSMRVPQGGADTAIVQPGANATGGVYG